MSRQVAEVAAHCLEAIRTKRTKVHCLTNTVAANITANTLLAIGAVPSMTDHPDEVGAFVSTADAVLVNLGTLTERQVAAIRIAVDTASDLKRPWVLDPVFVDRSPVRSAFAIDLMRKSPDAIRANESEIECLRNTGAPFNPRTMIALTGEKDRVSLPDGGDAITVANGHRLMPLVTGTGCALSAVVAAFLAVGKKDTTTVAAALLAYGVAGEVAGAHAAGPGSFAVALIDTLSALTPETISRKGRAE